MIGSGSGSGTGSGSGASSGTGDESAGKFVIVNTNFNNAHYLLQDLV